MTAWPPSPQLTGTHRSLEPAGAPLHVATRLDATSPINDLEVCIDVMALNIDATSYRQIRESCASDGPLMAQRIAEIVATRGKMHNPVTGSGGIALGRVNRVGSAHADPDGNSPAVGARVVPLVSLIALPLRLTSIGPVSPATPQVPVIGQAIITGLMPVMSVPDDLPDDLAMTIADIYPAAWHVADRIRPGDHLLILGAGHGGALAAAAGRAATRSQISVTVVDVDAERLTAVTDAFPDVVGVLADASDPQSLTSALADLGRGPGDLTVIATTAGGCEAAAIAATARRGTMLLFSTAISFSAAALGTDAFGCEATLVIPNGCTPDRGRQTIDLVRADPALAGLLVG
jgi:L-erythro-3,5-diaminohexanoate dehydrogenase